MRKSAILAAAFVAACYLTISAGAQPPEKGGKDDKGGPPGKGGPGFPGGPGGFGMKRGKPGEIMPPFLVDQLKMSDEQKKALADLQKDVDAKMDKLLTDDQKKQLKEMQDRGPGGFPGGKGGDPKGPPPGGDKGKGGPGGDKGKGGV